ncbi:T9SS type B sorting domain-containing protein [Gramella lutea]|uniref:T9SS type B sorting domain-containing protein n=1 Tax=Christiangramia lutea TaxID=1607951 RepID=A0A9X1V6K8_9FLAO|nr:T9SS type B sorting domain-containing protein [Christiangramia lutea]
MKTFLVLFLAFQFTSLPLKISGLGDRPVLFTYLAKEKTRAEPQINFKVTNYIFQSTSIEVCDYERGFGLSSTDGFASFNLLLAYPSRNSDIEFFENNNDLQNGLEIMSPENYRNTIAFNQTILARRTNGNGTEIIEDLNLTVIPIPDEPVPIGEYYVCNANTDGGPPTAIYNFEEIGRSIFGNEEVTFHANIDEAFENDENFVFGDVLAQELIVYVRKQNKCDPIYSLSLKILEKPEIEIEDQYQVCRNQGVLNLDLPEENLSYEWFKEIDNEQINLGANLEISESGTYIVIATATYNINNRLYECATEKSFTVEFLDNPEIENVEVTQGSNSQVLVQMTEPGEYEFSTSYLNNIYQDSNLFTEVPPGEHEIYAREKNGCGLDKVEISILAFPPFFTPNNDGINDFWQVKGITVPNYSVHIYDRYGKLLVKLNSNEKGWDGNFNGRNMPADDYWFRLKLQNGQEINGHFSLVR